LGTIASRIWKPAMHGPASRDGVRADEETMAMNPENGKLRSFVLPAAVSSSRIGGIY
jgi:hypothetical protein